MLCALIMAGGKGTRFWPLSTEEKPKQFLNLLGKKTMLQETVSRVNSIIPTENIFICTGSRYIDIVKEQLPDIQDRNIIIEPECRNTAPCIALSSLIIRKYYGNCKMIVLPADHLVSKNDEFIKKINSASNFLDDDKESIITFGIKPDRAETGYGYIKYDSDKLNGNKFNINIVDRFVEKPDIKTAEEYLKSGKYLWNSGIFMWNIDTIVKNIKLYMPNTYEALKEIEAVSIDKLQELINIRYKNTDCTSIDYGILEKCTNIYVSPCEFGWDDVGNWSSLGRYGIKDNKGNVFIANGLAYKSSNNIVVANKKILLNNIENLVVVETDEYIMISDIKYEQEIKEAQICSDFNKR